MIMNDYDINAEVEAFHQYSEKESPPFALDDHFPSPKDRHKNKFREPSSDFPKSNSTVETNSIYVKSRARYRDKNDLVMSRHSQHSSHSTPPELTESAMTGGTSCCSAFSSPIPDITTSMNHKMKIPSLSSLSHYSSTSCSDFTAASLTSVPLEPRLPNDDLYLVDCGGFKTSSTPFPNPHTIFQQSEKKCCSITSSEQMEAVNNSNTELEQSHPTEQFSDHRSKIRLQPVLENQEVESGALISMAPTYKSDRRVKKLNYMGSVRKWWHYIPFLESESQIANREVERSFLTNIAATNSNLLVSEQLHITSLLSDESFQHKFANLALERASAFVQTTIESDNSFEVSLLLGENLRCTVDDVMQVISNTDMLNIWYNPIETLIVTSNSNIDSPFSMSLDKTGMNSEYEGLTDPNICRDEVEMERQYEAKWIEATTSSLKSPSSSAGFILNAGQSILRSLGLKSYGRITMFIERRHGRIGMTIGPFHGGIYACHSMSVSSEDPSSNGGRIRIIDRVRLTSDNEEEFFFAGRMFGCAMGSCLGQFFFPSIAGYADQVTMNMARLRILLERNENIIRSTSHPFW